MDDLMTRCETLAARLGKPHSPFIDEAAAKQLREAAARIAALEAALREIIDTAWSDPEYALACARAALTREAGNE